TALQAGSQAPGCRIGMDQHVPADARRATQPSRGFPRANQGDTMTKTTRDPATGMTVSTQRDREIHTERMVNAPRDRVWHAFTEPELVAQWWGRGNKLEIERLEVEKGGHWRFVEHADG